MISDVNDLKKSADCGDSSAQYEYGQLCYQSCGVASYALEDSFYYFLLSAEQGNPDAQFCVGAAYYHGEGTVQNYVEAVKWFQKAADQGQVNALFNLGICYESGFGVEKDLKKSLVYYRRAVRAGHGDKARQAVRGVKQMIRQSQPLWVRMVWRVLWSCLVFLLIFCCKKIF